MNVRVLVVEDEPEIAAAHAAYVRRVPGFEVAGTVGTADAALRHVRAAAGSTAPIDLVLAGLGLA